MKDFHAIGDQAQWINLGPNFSEEAAKEVLQSFERFEKGLTRKIMIRDPIERKKEKWRYFRANLKHGRFKQAFKVLVEKDDIGDF